jgi:hypothetical protein
LTPRRVRLDLTRPPVFFPGRHSPSPLQNCCPVAHRDTPGPSTLITGNAVTALIPALSVTASPTTSDNAVRPASPGVWTRRLGRVCGGHGGPARSPFLRPHGGAICPSPCSPWPRVNGQASQASCNAHRCSSRDVPVKAWASSASLALQPLSRSVANFTDARVPRRIARRLARPLTPVRALRISVSFRFLGSRAFGRGGPGRLAERIRLARGRR